ncbi:NEDD8 ligase [Saccharomycopsis crataegensis]|uniref:Defective in cullin neddylation protein n=1 Tax=Saccharomycopsis crataegensis TaxID=43959 RepID=A0AAV5QMI9_9ASCO|nr:NEDD8 ligase [Saccharomycopsis crataegensis]
MEDHKSLKQQFREFTSGTPSQAQYWLNKYNWDLYTAVDQFLSKHPDSHNRPTSGNATTMDNGQDQKIVNIFNKYKDQSSGKIEIEGTIQYLQDLGIDPEDPASLVLSYTLGSPSTGVFERDSFVDTWEALDCTDLPSMTTFIKTKTANLHTNLPYLRKVYEFTFGYILEPHQKKVSAEDAAMYWQLLLQEVFPRVELWTEFINDDWQKPITRDAWNMLFLFLQDFEKDPKLENYDDAASWPSIIDSFVEWAKENEKLE